MSVILPIRPCVYLWHNNTDAQSETNILFHAPYMYPFLRQVCNDTPEKMYVAAIQFWLFLAIKNHSSEHQIFETSTVKWKLQRSINTFFEVEGNIS